MRKAIAVTVVAVVGSAVLTGCGLKSLGDETDGTGAGPDPAVSGSFTPKAPVPRGKPLDEGARVPSPPRVDDQDPTSVTRAWAILTYSHDTAYDAGPQDAVLRGSRYLVPERAAAEREHTPAGGTGSEWGVWAEHKAWTTVRLTFGDGDDGDVPADTASVAYREVFVDGRARGRDGWTGDGPRLMVSVKLSRSGGGPWRVADVKVTVAAVPSPSVSAPASASSPPVRKN